MDKDAVLLDLNAIAVEPGAKGNFTCSVVLPPSDELICEGPIAVTLEVQNTGQALLARGQFQGKVQLVCARCLQDTVLELQGKFNEQFSLPGASDPDLQLIDQLEPAESAFAKQILDVSELLRQQLLLALPLRALCSPSCEGLCPACGVNLNLNVCQCPKTEGSPAWEVLRDLMEKGKE
jgi:uncharacterized protein